MQYPYHRRILPSYHYLYLVLLQASQAYHHRLPVSQHHPSLLPFPDSPRHHHPHQVSQVLPHRVSSLRCLLASHLRLPDSHPHPLASLRPQAGTLPHRRGSSTASRLHLRASSRAAGPHLSLRPRDLVPPHMLPHHLYLLRPRQRQQQCLPRHSYVTLRRRVPHSCPLLSNASVLHQVVAVAVGRQVRSMLRPHSMARALVKHRVLRLHDLTL